MFTKTSWKINIRDNSYIFWQIYRLIPIYQKIYVLGCDEQ